MVGPHFYLRRVAVGGTVSLEEYDRVKKENDILKAKVDVGLDSRLKYFSFDVQSSNGKHSKADTEIERYYGKKCIFCGSGESDTIPITKAHIIAETSSESRVDARQMNYTEFNPPNYNTILNPKSPRNFLPLCGRLGMHGTCHHEFDSYKLALLYNPLNKKYHTFCFDPAFEKYAFLHKKEIGVKFAPYHRLLAWRARWCALVSGHLVEDKEFMINFASYCNFVEEGHSMAGKSASSTASSDTSTSLLPQDEESWK